tara:strand:+ start:41 stop:565 length:525 start_codon:yes stop_codon:yes gene_type:complete
MTRGYKLKDRPEFLTKPKPLTFLKSVKVSEAVKVMAEKNYGCVVAVDEENKVTGICTERDILKRLVAKNLDPKTTNLSEIMTDAPRVGRENDEVLDWLRTMSNDRFRRLPVVDENGRIRVIFTQGDFVSYTWPDLFYHAKQMAKATISKHFNLSSILIMIMLYSIAIIFAIKYI